MDVEVASPQALRPLSAVSHTKLAVGAYVDCAGPYAIYWPLAANCGAPIPESGAAVHPNM